MRRKAIWTSKNWGNRKGRPWTNSDVECANFLRHCGLTNTDIGSILNRSEASVTGKIGYVACRKYAKFYERLRPIIAKQIGAMADDFQTVGNA